MVILLAEATRVPPLPPFVAYVRVEIVLVGLGYQLLSLPRQARHVSDAQFWRRNALTISTSASTYEAFSRARMHGLETDVAFLPLRVVGARLPRARRTFFSLTAR